MFTSKEVLERTGISRATLNNYISSGLLPRPDVLPPDPSAGSAPRIGYFPDDTVDRILEIQRLKTEGWSIGRIALHFEQRARGEPGLESAPGAVAAPATGALEVASAVPASSFFEEVEHPAYGVGSGFELLWSNAAIHAGAVGRLLSWPAGPAKGVGILELLLRSGRDPATDELVGFHLTVARERGTALADLCRGLTAEQSAVIGRRLQSVRPPAAGSVAIARLPLAGSERGIAVHAVRLRTGVVFLYAPPAHDDAPAPQMPATTTLVPAAATRLQPVAVLATRLQDAEAWWRRLPAPEFLELMADLRATIDPVIAAQGGSAGYARHAGFDAVFTGHDSDHLARAVRAAQALREAMRVLSRRWQARKGWTAELHLNTGLAEGHEWIGEAALPGDAAQQAAALAHAGRDASVWATRALADRLPAAVRAGLRLAAPVAGPVWTPVDGCYARLSDLVEARGGAPTEVAPRFADLAVAVLAPAATAGDSNPPAARPPHEA
ncbi:MULTISPECIES: MerR family transcriptional regulator [Ramlibacter]|uniref:MerR family transcriptional regulator n=1 Tax=Ramlibacter pinisoli TaxID=2682844 RepID=A0A6N8IV03_9BURK|nr:MerR family transcriptional regulator [Ramlibacter sp. CGMCC 1.13660]MVQ30799.1 MerR family transcriptional regulator [Ramlibacter pinisoli]